MTVLKTETETETAVFSRNTDRNRPSSDDPEPLQHYCSALLYDHSNAVSTIQSIETELNL